MSGGVDIATLGLEIRSDGVVTASNRLREFQQQAGHVEKGVKNIETSSASLSRTVVGLAAKMLSLYASIQTGTAIFNKAFQAVETYNQSIASLAAMVTTFGQRQAGQNLAGQWQDALKYSTAMIPVLEAISARTLLSGEETTALANAFARSGIFLDALNAKQMESFTRISNALPLMTQGQDIMRQINTEIRSVMNGTNEASSMLLTTLKGIDPQIEKHLKLWREEGTVLENIGGLLSGFGPATELLENQWQAVKSTIDTTATQILRGLMLPAYEAIIEKTKELNESLITNKDEIAEWGTTMHMMGIRIAQEFRVIAMALDKIGGSMTQVQMLLYGPGMMMGNESSVKRFDAAFEANKQYQANFEKSDSELAALEKRHTALAFSLTEEGKAQAKAAAEHAGAIPKITGLAIANEDAANAADKLAKKAADQYKQANEELQYQISLLGLSEREQYALNQVRAHGLSIDSSAAEGVKKLAYAYYDQKEAIEAVRKEQEKWIADVEYAFSDEGMNEASIKLHEGQLAAELASRKEMETALDEADKRSVISASRTEDAWVKAAENIQDAWSGLLTDILTGEFSGVEDYADGLGKAFASSFSNQFTAGLSKGIADGMLEADAAGTSLLGGALSGAAGAANPWLLAGSVAMTGLSSLLGDKGPSYGERLADSIDDMIDALKENTQSLRDQLNGTTDLEISIRELNSNVYEKEVGDTGKSLTDSFKIPEGMTQRGRSFVDGLKAVGSAVFALPTGGASLTAMPQILDKGYTSYDYSPEEASSVIEELASKMGLADFLNMMKETTTNAGALITALKDNALLSGELPQRVLDYYSKGDGSKDDRNRKVAEGVVAQLTEDLLKVGVEAQKIGQSITDFASDWDSRDISEYAKAMSEVDETLGKNKDNAKDFFDALLGGDVPLADRIAQLSTATSGPGGAATALETLISLTGLTKDEILNLANAEEIYNRILSEKQAYFAIEQQKIITDMTREMDIATGKYSDLDQTYMGIMDKAEAYRVELTNQGMGYEEAAIAVTNYANVMKDAAKEVQKAADAAEIKGIIDPAKDVVAQSSMTDLEKTIYGITQRYAEQFETLTKLNASADEFNALDTAKQIELNAARESAYDDIKDFYDTLKEKVSDLLWDLKGGSLASVQSSEMMNARYQELYQEALNTGDVSKFESFVSGEFANFAKGFGNWSETSAKIIADVEALESKLGTESTASLADVTGELSQANTSLAEIATGVNTMNQTFAALLNTSGFAAGGYPSGLSMVGERGPELIVSNNSRVFSNQDTNAMLRAALSSGGGSNITVKVYLPDGSEFKNIIAKTIETHTETQYQVQRVAKAA